MRSMQAGRIVCGVMALVLGAGALTGAAGADGKTIAEFTAGMECQPGFVPLCWDGKTGKLYMEVSRFGEDLLYVASQASGLARLFRKQRRGQAPLRDGGICAQARVTSNA